MVTVSDKSLQNKQIFRDTIARIIKEYRLKQNKSISLISAEIGMTKSMWADTEKGIKDPQFSTLCRMIEGLNISLIDFCTKFSDNLPEDFSLID